VSVAGHAIFERSFISEVIGLKTDIGSESTCSIRARVGALAIEVYLSKWPRDSTGFTYHLDIPKGRPTAWASRIGTCLFL